MTDTDLGPLGARLVALGELFEVTFSETKIALYFEALKDLPLDVVIQALNLAVRDCTFMPKPTELRALVLGDPEDVTEAAWLLWREGSRVLGAYRSVICDAALGETLTAVFGGWCEACVADYSPEMWAAKRKEFDRVYRVMADRYPEGQRYLVGQIEQTNAARVEWASYTAVGVLEPDHVRPLAASELGRYLAPPVVMGEMTALHNTSLP